MTDEDSLSEGELEDGEVLSSEEEEQGSGDAKVCVKKGFCVVNVIRHFFVGGPLCFYF